MLTILAYSLNGKMFASFETRKYEFPFVYTVYYSPYTVTAYGTRLNLGYYFSEGFGLYVALGTGYGKNTFTIVDKYEGSYYSSYTRLETISTLLPVEAGLGLSFVPFRGERGLLRVSPEFRFTYLSDKEYLKDSTVEHYTDPYDTTIVSVTDTTYFIKATEISLPVSLGGEYFITDKVSLRLDYGFYLLSIGSTTMTQEGSSDTISNRSLNILKPADRFRFGATFYF